MEKEKTGRQKQAEETKRHIFEVALRMLEQQGFEAIKVRDIAEKAGVSVGTFYNYYETKLDVFYETYTLADEYFAQVVAPSLTQETARERILEVMDQYARYSCELTELSLTKLLYNSDNRWFNREAQAGIVSTLRDQVAYGLDRGELRGQETPEEIAQFLMIAARGLVYNWCTKNGDYPLRPAMREFVERLLRAF